MPRFLCRNYLLFLRYTVILGSFLLNFPSGTSMFYGNLAAYTNSYFMFELGPDSMDIEPTWPIVAVAVMYVLGVLTVDWCLRILNTIVTCIIALIFFNLGTFLTYFTVQHSLSLMMVSLMMCCGYSGGVVRALSFKFAHIAMPKRFGLASAIITSASGLGSMVYNYIITSYINPDNITPNNHLNNMVYFSQPSLLKRVPYVFLYMGIYSLACSLLGFLMHQLPFCFTNFDETSEKARSTNHTYFNEQSALTTSSSETFRTLQPPEGTIELDPNPPFQNGDMPRDETNPIHQNAQSPDIHPLHLLKNRSFYLLCFSIAVLTQGQFVTLNYYKLYGQLWIKDDYFLLSIISFAAFVIALSNLLTGIIIDKTGIKNSLIITLSLSGLGTNLWFFAPRLNKWLYFFSCQLMIGAQGTTSLIFPVAVVKLYGSSYFASNYGLILITSIVANLISPSLFSSILKAYDWYGITLFVTVVHTMAVFCVVCLLPTNACKME